MTFALFASGYLWQVSCGVTDCNHDAVILSGMIEAIDLMGNEGKNFDCARVSVTMDALEKAKRLAADLDEVAS